MWPLVAAVALQARVSRGAAVVSAVVGWPGVPDTELGLVVVFPQLKAVLQIPVQAGTQGFAVGLGLHNGTAKVGWVPRCEGF